MTDYSPTNRTLKNKMCAFFFVFVCTYMILKKMILCRAECAITQDCIGGKAQSKIKDCKMHQSESERYRNIRISTMLLTC